MVVSLRTPIDCLIPYFLKIVFYEIDVDSVFFFYF